MKKQTKRPASLLLKRGVIIPEPELVCIDSSVNPANIGPGTIIHPFCRLAGAATSVGPGCQLGTEGPLTIVDCQLGSDVKLAGGYCSGAVFLDGSSMGSCAHVRPGTILEECSSLAHAVGLKQTVLFPYVILGSLINFCDCLMAGGTSRKNHSEVGSSYVHFNYTPHRDKATPSLIGDVPGGVFLDCPPIFLGGQGGLVGPARVTFGAIIPAGMVQRRDVMEAGLVPFSEQTETTLSSAAVNTGQNNSSKNSPFKPGAYRAIDRIVRNNLIYIGNIFALSAWYRHIRVLFKSSDKFQNACRAGALSQLDCILQERIKRLDEMADKMPESIALNKKMGNEAAPFLRRQEEFRQRWPAMKAALAERTRFEGDSKSRDSFVEKVAQIKGLDYLEAIPAMDDKSKKIARAWLQSIVDRAEGIWKAGG